MYEHREWSPHSHRTFPATFQQAARALLLAAVHGRSAEAGEQAHRLALLDDHALHSILGYAARPLSAWV